MLTRRAADLLIVAMAVTIAAVCVAVVGGAGLPEFVFLTVLLWGGFTVARLAIEAGRRAAFERLRARGLATIAVDEVARRAVAEERVRLAADIEAVVRASVTKMGEHARSAEDRWHADPTPTLAAVQDEGRHAVTELRRMLGLLREADQADADPPAASSTPRRGNRIDVLLGLAAVGLSVAERYPVTDDVPAGMQTPVALILTATAASMLVLRRRAPAAGAAACGAVFLAGALSGHPLTPGWWIILTPGWLAWAAMVGRTLTGVAGATGSELR